MKTIKKQSNMVNKTQDVCHSNISLSLCLLDFREF